MTLAFWKMHGAGNDFILVDDRALDFPAANCALIARLCARRTGVGSDGLVLLQPADDADIGMRFFNPDGGEAELCANAARCLCRLAHDLGAAPATMRIHTGAGVLRAEARAGGARLHLAPPSAWRMDRTLTAGARTVHYHAVNTGVPHAVIRTEDLDRCDVRGLGAAVRRHPEFAPAGTNVDFFDVVEPGTLRVRTYERGVEDETLACGTGITAAALVAARLGLAAPPVAVLTAGGIRLEVAFTWHGGRADGIALTGPAAYVYRGTAEDADT